MNKDNVNMDIYKKDLLLGKRGEISGLIYMKEILKINNIYKRKMVEAPIDFWIGKEEDDSNTDIEIEIKTRSDRYYWGRCNTWIFGENKLREMRRKLKNNLTKRAFVFFYMFKKYNNEGKGYGKKEMWYWEVKLDNDNEIYKVSKDIFSKKRNGTPELNVEIHTKHLKHLTELII
jgi:hypothetical protein